MPEALTRVQELFVDLIVSLPGFLLGALVFLIFYLAGGFVRRGVVLTVRRSRRRMNVAMVLGRLAQAGMLVAGLLIGFTIAVPSFEPGQLISLVGIASVAIGFAFRDILQDMLAGILLLLTEPFQIGDQIRMGEHEGTVETIKTSHTYIRTYDNRRLVIPNGELFTRSVVVNTAFDRRRSEFEVAISYDDDPDAAVDLIQHTLSGSHRVLSDPAPDVLLIAIDDLTTTLRVRWWTAPQYANQLTAQDAVLRQLRADLRAAGFTLPHPIRRVRLEQ